jgi:hypothetical protein
MRKFALAAICTFTAVGLAMAEDFTLQITKIGDDGTVTGTKLAGGKGGKGGGFGKKGEEVTLKMPSSVQVYKGKFDADAKGLVKEGDDLKLASLRSALKTAENGNVTVGGKSLADKDVLELSVKDGKPSAKLNGKDIDFADVRVVAKGPLTTRVTTNDDGNVTTVLIGGGGFGGGGFGKKKAGK